MQRKMIEKKIKKERTKHDLTRITIGSLVVLIKWTESNENNHYIINIYYNYLTFIEKNCKKKTDAEENCKYGFNLCVYVHLSMEQNANGIKHFFLAFVLTIVIFLVHIRSIYQCRLWQDKSNLWLFDILSNSFAIHLEPLKHTNW